LNRTLSHEDSKEIEKGINTVSNKWLNGYDNKFESGLSPIGSDPVLSAQTQLNGLDSALPLRARLRTAGPWRWPAGPRRPRARGEVGWAALKIQPNKLAKIVNPFSFSNLFYKFQTNSNSNQI
jgi:hypothetical protein